ncbi:MAG: alpha-L-fucosidase [Opitutaceae bacterium]
MKIILRKTILSISLLAFVLSAPLAQALKVNSRGPLLNDPAREQEFMDWGLGMFVHWSHDSQLGSVISHSMVGASDDYLDRYINELPKTFNPRRYDPDEWMEIAKLAGVKYMVFTTKHHNGFCMWDTKTTDFSIMNTPYGKDIVKDYVDACRRHGIKVGFYFSPEDFYFQHGMGLEVRRVGRTAEEKPPIAIYNKKQLDELLTNYGDIDVVFFDGGEKEMLTQYVHQKWPKVLVTRGEMETPEQKLPKEPIPGPWESCFTLGSQWQYKPTNEDYKSGDRLIKMLIENRAKGGNLLLNVGPEPNGIIPFEQERAFRELALWMFINGEAIHDIRPCPVISEENIYYTQSKDGKSVYVFLNEFTDKNRWKKGDRKEILLKELKATSDTKISVLGQNSRILEYNKGADVESRFKQNEAGLEISVMRAQRIYNNQGWPNTVVVKLENVEFANK